MSEWPDEENLRLLLQINYDRLNHLANIIHASNGFVVGLLGAILAFDVTKIPFLIVVIGIFSIVIWRWYACYVDDDIIKTYGLIVKIERRMPNLPKEFTLAFRSIEGLSINDDMKKKYKENFYIDLDEILKLIQDKKINPRGQDTMNRLSVSLGFGLYFWVVIQYLQII
jgi:hypothetical protein